MAPGQVDPLTGIAICQDLRGHVLVGVKGIKEKQPET